MSTFSEMAEAWLRERMPPAASAEVAATKGTGTEGMADHDPDAWRNDFIRWARERCSHPKGRADWGGIGALHVDFCQWAVENDSVPCQRRVFERMLADSGFAINDHAMVLGLLLRADLQAHADFAGHTARILAADAKGAAMTHTPAPGDRPLRSDSTGTVLAVHVSSCVAVILPLAEGINTKPLQRGNADGGKTCVNRSC